MSGVKLRAHQNYPAASLLFPPKAVKNPCSPAELITKNRSILKRNMLCVRGRGPNEKWRDTARKQPLCSELVRTRLTRVSRNAKPDIPCNKDHLFNGIYNVRRPSDNLCCDQIFARLACGREVGDEYDTGFMCVYKVQTRNSPTL